MQVYQSKFADAFFDKEKSLFTVVWKDPKQKMTDEDFKITLAGYIEKLVELKPRLFLFDATNVFFPIDPELQRWMNEYSLARSRDIVEKEAVCVKNDLIMKLSAEQTLGDEPEKTTIRRIFTSAEEGLKWLLYE